MICRVGDEHKVVVKISKEGDEVFIYVYLALSLTVSRYFKKTLLQLSKRKK